jgi:uncharacterized protein YndB with AHSA1/START domain
MMDEVLSTTMTIKAPAKTIFGILADPATHAAIDGTGWVCEPLDADPLTAADQVFRMAMFREQAGGDYVMANKVTVFEPPHAISWEPGVVMDGREQRYGRWVWRYDLAPVTESETEVTLTYDWSAVSQATRDRMPFQFPPFPPEYLDQSLRHLAELT